MMLRYLEVSFVNDFWVALNEALTIVSLKSFDTPQTLYHRAKMTLYDLSPCQT